MEWNFITWNYWFTKSFNLNIFCIIFSYWNRVINNVRYLHHDTFDFIS